ncbi:MAG: hypothetical protein FWH40_10140 [Coriobacteriia bacterium]|nr:hypothetical protein [Coriobacteriia bacterium]
MRILNRKTKIAAAVAIVLVVGAASILVGIRIHQQNEQRQQETADAYLKVNYAAGLMVWSKSEFQVYVPFYRAQYGGYDEDKGMYFFLNYYKNQTGATFEYDTLVDYFEDEFEPDGSLRLYNNGLHPEIEAFVDWAWVLKEEGDRNGDRPGMSSYSSPWYLRGFEDYIRNLMEIYSSYFHEQEDIVESDYFFYSQPLEVYDELIKKLDDPNYKLDLMPILVKQR